jgi:hypothetical protein
MAALNSRPNLSNENWVIISSTDHGGNGFSHGGTTLDETNIFFVVSGDSVENIEIAKSSVITPASASLAFDGTNDYVSIPDVAQFDFGSTTDFTIECRVKSTGWSSDPSIISDKDWVNGFNSGFGLFCQTDGATWKMNIGDGLLRQDLNGGTINDDEWHHIAATFDRDGDAVIYQDGEEVGRGDISFLGDISSGMGLGIGQDGTLTYSDFYSGNIDEIRIWQKVIDEPTLNDWRCSYLDFTHPDYPSLLGFWSIDANGGTTVFDGTMNGNNGTISDATWDFSLNSLTCDDYAGVPEIVDVAYTALKHLCIPIHSAWELDGRAWVENNCPIVTAIENHDVANSPTISIFPNPASQQLTLTFLHRSPHPLSATLKNILGSTITHELVPANASHFEIDVSSLAAGLYFIEVASGDEKWLRRFVKE